MKAIVQKVTRASVTVGDREVGAIGKGLCVLLGITRVDTPREAEWMARKLLNLRLFADPATPDRMWDKSVLDLGLEVLCVSQFTLCHVLKGNKPDFHNAMGAEASGPMFQDFLKLLGSMYREDKIQTGEFGAMMQVHIQNDGPVTLAIETPQLPPQKERKAQNAASGRRGSKDNRKGSVDSQKGSEVGGGSGTGAVAAAVSGLSLQEEAFDQT